MMDELTNQLNNLLVDTFRTILKVEEQMLQKHPYLDLSISEMHLIESVGKGGGEGLTISSIAEDLSISLPSVTVAINKLQTKGFVEKARGETDSRMVYVKLTRNGRRVNALHQSFHEAMVHNITADMDEAEKEALVRGVAKLNVFFKDKF
jgi:DNA-binding MarR family transcriptional regulator